MPAHGPCLGRANFILDNLIAQGKAKPMIVVMTLGYGAPEIVMGPRASFNHVRLAQEELRPVHAGAAARK